MSLMLLRAIQCQSNPTKCQQRFSGQRTRRLRPSHNKDGAVTKRRRAVQPEPHPLTPILFMGRTLLILRTTRWPRALWLGHSGLDTTSASRRSRQGPRLRDMQPAAPLDCTPPIGAEVLPPLSQVPAAMEVEVQTPSLREPDEAGLAIESGRAQTVAPSGR